MADLSEQNRKWLAAKVKRDRQFHELLTLHIAIVVVAAAFFLFGLPEQQRLDRINQEQVAYK